MVVIAQVGMRLPKSSNSLLSISRESTHAWTKCASHSLYPSLTPEMRSDMPLTVTYRQPAEPMQAQSSIGLTPLPSYPPTCQNDFTEVE